MKRFENAKVGDKVYCRLWGPGMIQKTDYKEDYPVRVLFGEQGDQYTIEGKYYTNNFEQVLFYRDETSNYLETRPEPTIKASLLPVDTKLTVQLVREGTPCNRHFSKSYDHDIFVWVNGKSSFTAGVSDLVSVKTCTLAEDIEIEGILYPTGTLIKGD